MTPDAPPRDAFTAWLRRLAGCERARALAMRPVAGGASNLTFRVPLAHAPLPAVALRLQRERGIFEPYDVAREAAVLRRLAPSPVPVPRVLGVEPDAAVLGAPFAVLEWVDAPHMGEAADARVGLDAHAAMMARIHALDWRALGLGRVLDVPDPASAERRWLERTAARMERFPGADDPLLRRALAVLRESAPAAAELALCHGDVNVFNYLVRDGEVVAVVDWEQARIGDPRADAAQLPALAHLRGAPFGPVRDQPSVRLWERARGAGATRGLEWFRARWLFELGVIHRGWTAFNDDEPWYSRALLAELLERALDEVGRAPPPLPSRG